MYKTKKEIDAHVHDIFNKTPNEKERNLRCFAVAKAYYGIREYYTAKRYLENYINSNPLDPSDAFKFMGDILSDMGEKEKALDYYKASYDSSKNRIVLNRICDLLHLGVGEKENEESKKKWFQLQKSVSISIPVSSWLTTSTTTVASSDHSSFLSGSPLAISSPAVASRSSGTGPPRTKLGFHLVNGNENGYENKSTLSRSHAQVQTGDNLNTSRMNRLQASPERADLQMRYMERHYDDVLTKLLEQNYKIFNQLTALTDEFKDYRETTERSFSEVLKRINETKINNVSIEQTDASDPVSIGVRHSTPHTSQVQPNLVGHPQHSSHFCYPSTNYGGYPPQMFLPAPMADPLSYFTNPYLAGLAAMYTNAANPLQQHIGLPPTLPQGGSYGLGLAGAAPSTAAQLPATTFPTIPSATGDISLTANDGTEQQVISELFKGNEGSWGCSLCYIINDKTQLKCTSCFATKPGLENELQREENKTVRPFPRETQFPTIPTTVVEEVKPTKPQNSFTSLSFTPTSTKEKDLSNEPKKLFENRIIKLATGFSELAKKDQIAEEHGGGFEWGFKGFQGIGGPVFGGSTTIPKSQTSVPGQEIPTSNQQKLEEGDDDFVPTAEFVPVIPLPPLVEVKKGDEEETLVFEVRAKLYRFESSTKEWKERGIGNIKILQNKSDPTKARIVMWREQVQKVACNHRIPQGMTITSHMGNPKALTWTAMDYSEEGGKSEIFVCRFGKEKQCEEFKNHIDQMIHLVNSSTKSSVGSPPVVEKTKIANDSTEQIPISELFKRSEGSWECTSCYVINNNMHFKCVSCSSSKPGCENEKMNSIPDAKVSISAVTPPFSFNFPARTSPASDQGFSFCFKVPALAGSRELDRFQGIGGPVFGGSTTIPKSQTSVPGQGIPTSNQQKLEEGDDDFVPTAEFVPVIPLPPLVEVKKGDEEETLVFEVRAKLYRFESSTKEWKERGIGNIKILQNKSDPTKARIVMWREQVQKVACNHRIPQGMTITSHMGNSKALTWTAMDYSEEGGKSEIFVCRFGKEKQCEEFKNHIDQMIHLVNSSTKSSVGSPPVVEKTKIANDSSEQIPISELFKRSEGSWECTSCYVINNNMHFKCVSCSSSKPGCENEKMNSTPDAKVSISAVTPPFSFIHPARTSHASDQGFSFGFKVPALAGSRELDNPGSISCSGCTGCDPDKFDFSKLDGRALPTYPQQTMTPEEIVAYSKQIGPPLNTPIAEVVDNNFKALTTPPSKPQLPSIIETPKIATVIDTPVVSDTPKARREENQTASPFPRIALFPTTPSTETAEVSPARTQNPFASVSFAPTREQETFSNKEFKNPFESTLIQSATGFGELAKQGEVAGAFGGFTRGFKGFEGVGSPVFGGSTTISKIQSGDPGQVTLFKSEQRKVEGDDDFVPTAEFVPVIPLPPLVEVKKGDEEETLVFEVRAKLYRFESSTKEWKEKGTGNIKILQNKSDPAKVRIVMWREQVQKVACNHRIPQGMSIRSHMGNQKALTWAAMDYSEEGGKSEIFVCRFGNEKQCEEFKNRVEEMIELVNNSTNSTPPSPAVDKTTATTNGGMDITKTEQQPISELFKRSEDSGVCSAGTGLLDPMKPFVNFSGFKLPEGQTSLFGGFTSPAKVGADTSIYSTPSTTLENTSSQVNSSGLLERSNSDDADDDEDEEPPMFEGDCHVYLRNANEIEFTDLGIGTIRVSYDGEMYCSRFSFTSSDVEVVVDHYIIAETQLENTADLTYEWDALNETEDHHLIKCRLRTIFSNTQDFENFSDRMADSIEMAAGAGVTEQYLLDEEH